MIIKQFNSSKSFSCNVYVCSKNNVNFIIDPGFFSEKMKAYIDSIGGLDFILLTHGHFDHFLGVDELINIYPNCKIYIHEEEIDLLFDSRKNGTKLFLNKNYEPSFNINSILSGILYIDGIDLEVIYNPGHTIGSCSFYFKDDNVMFVGDFIFSNSIGRCDLPTGSVKQMNQSLESFKLKEFDLDLIIYPGHDNFIKLRKLLLINPYLNNF